MERYATRGVRGCTGVPLPFGQRATRPTGHVDPEPGGGAVLLGLAAPEPVLTLLAVLIGQTSLGVCSIVRSGGKAEWHEMCSLTRTVPSMSRRKGLRGFRALLSPEQSVAPHRPHVMRSYLLLLAGGWLGTWPGQPFLPSRSGRGQAARGREIMVVSANH
jgi:hypothetical protein